MKPEDMIRIGVVSSVDATNHAARVFFRDKGDMVSDWLKVLQHGSDEDWMPDVNDTVLVLYGADEDSDGYILGVIL